MAYTKFDLIPLKAFRGNTETYTFSVTNSAGAAYSLSGYTITSEIRRSEESEEILISSTITDAQNGNVFSAGTIVLVISATDTNTLPDLAVGDIKAVNGTTVLTVARFEIAATAKITR